MPRASRRACRRSAATTPMASAIVGLAGPRTTPRALIDVMARLTGAGKDKRGADATPKPRRCCSKVLRGAADYGTASAFKAAACRRWPRPERS